jgi:hypothetical protein
MAERLPRARPQLDRLTEALTRDVPITSQAIAPKATPRVVTDPNTWEDRFAAFLERVMATAAVGGDAEPLKKELDALLLEAPPGKREELEKNRGKPAS